MSAGMAVGPLPVTSKGEKMLVLRSIYGDNKEAVFCININDISVVAPYEAENGIPATKIFFISRPEVPLYLSIPCEKVVSSINAEELNNRFIASCSRSYTVDSPRGQTVDDIRHPYE